MTYVHCPPLRFSESESIEQFIEDQAFLSSYDSASPPPLSRQKVVSLSQSSCGLPVEPTDGRWGDGVDEEPNHTTMRKSGPL
jgi:hypothetical protein